ncbi:28202_t:CDS:2, partial [Dentiscutata erythropus]
LLFKILDTNIQDIDVANINIPDINIQDINIQDINIQDINVQDINVQDIFNRLIRSTFIYTESNLETLSTCSLQVDHKISQDCKYCIAKYTSSTSTRTLKEHIIKSLQPFSVTEEELFIEMPNKFNPHYKVPSHHYISLYITRTFLNHQANLSKDLQKISGMVALTTDMWAFTNNYFFLGVTIYWIDSN